MGGLYFIGFVFMLLGMFVQWRLKSKFSQYSQVPLANGMSGRDIAAKMLHDNGIMDVQITQVDGQLTDHYNPADHTVNLWQRTSVATLCSTSWLTGRLVCARH
jgi:uncharacterized protein